jgi:hypothetical protein
MELARPYIQRGRGHAGLGKQPTRCQLQSRQGTLPAVAVRAVSIDLTEYASATPITDQRGPFGAGGERRMQLCADGCGENTSPFDDQGPALKKSI